MLAILQPTWGVDAAAAASIHRAIQELASNGAAVLLISQDLDELMAVSTTFAVIAGGRLSAPQPTDSITVEEIGILMGGAQQHSSDWYDVMIRLEPRKDVSPAMAYLAPALAVLVTACAGTLIFAALGKDPIEAMRLFFIQPLGDWFSISEMIVKATPLILIAIGLSFGFRAGVWNIGAEGQFTLGALAGGATALALYDRRWILGPAVNVHYRRARWHGLGSDPSAVADPLQRQRNSRHVDVELCRRAAVECLGSWCLERPRRHELPGEPPVPRLRHTPNLCLRAHAPISGFLAALAVVGIAWFALGRHIFGFQVKVMGQAPRAARFGGFVENRVIWFSLLLSGGLAGSGGRV